LQVLKDAGVVDAGGAGFLLLLDSVLYVVDGEPLRSPSPMTAPAVRWQRRSTPWPAVTPPPPASST
jgi:dihydroxyacetone kinase-like predicted kinase